MPFRQTAVPGGAYINWHNPGHQYAVPGVGYLSDTTTIEIGSPFSPAPVEWRVAIRRDATVPDEWNTGAPINVGGSGIPVQWLSKPGGDTGGGSTPSPGATGSGIPVEWRTQGGGGFGGGGGGGPGAVFSGIPVEWRAATPGPIPGISGPISFIPVEWRAGSVTVTATRPIPVEWRATISPPASIPVEILATSVNAAGIPVEFKVSVVVVFADANIPVEFNVAPPSPPGPPSTLSVISRHYRRPKYWQWRGFLVPRR